MIDVQVASVIRPEVHLNQHMDLLFETEMGSEDWNAFLNEELLSLIHLRRERITKWVKPEHAHTTWEQRKKLAQVFPKLCVLLHYHIVTPFKLCPSDLEANVFTVRHRRYESLLAGILWTLLSF